MKMGQSVTKRLHIKFRRQGIIQKKEYNTQNTAKVRKFDFVLYKNIPTAYLYVLSAITSTKIIINKVG